MHQAKPSSSSSSSSAGRPQGTDGSDYAFRMTVENKYKKAAQARAHLQKAVAAQAAFQLLRSLWMGLMVLNGEKLDKVVAVSCAFGGTAVLVATYGLRKSESGLLKLYMLLTVAASCSPLMPIITGQLQRKVSNTWKISQQTGDFKAMVLVLLGLLQECAATIVQMFGIMTAINLAQTFTTKKKA